MDPKDVGNFIKGILEGLLQEDNLPGIQECSADAS